MVDDQTPLIPEQNDWLLQGLVDFINGSERELGITLQVGGLLVSGILVSGHKYFSGFGSDYVGGIADKDLAEERHAEFVTFGETYKRATQEKEEKRSLPLYIHLKNAKYHAPAGNPVPTKQSSLVEGAYFPRIWIQLRPAEQSRTVIMLPLWAGI